MKTIKDIIGEYDNRKETEKRKYDTPFGEHIKKGIYRVVINKMDIYSSSDKKYISISLDVESADMINNFKTIKFIKLSKYGIGFDKEFYRSSIFKMLKRINTIFGMYGIEIPENENITGNNEFEIVFNMFNIYVSKFNNSSKNSKSVYMAIDKYKSNKGGWVFFVANGNKPISNTFNGIEASFEEQDSNGIDIDSVINKNNEDTTNKSDDDNYVNNDLPW